MNRTHQHRRYFVVVPIVESDAKAKCEREISAFAQLTWTRSDSGSHALVHVELAPFPIMALDSRADAELAREALIAVFQTPGMGMRLRVSAGNQDEPGIIVVERIHVVELDVTYTWASP
jgi:hypothetical protein